MYIQKILYSSLIGLMVSHQAYATDDIIHDSEYVRMEQQFGKQWRADDALVKKKLAALEAKFGKKPNIVYILADDIGYTELGSYGGGKVRGAPTPSLDKMADQGIRFFFKIPTLVGIMSIVYLQMLLAA